MNTLAGLLTALLRRVSMETRREAELPALGLRRGLATETVVAPYASVLALPVVLVVGLFAVTAGLGVEKKEKQFLDDLAAFQMTLFTNPRVRDLDVPAYDLMGVHWRGGGRRCRC